MLAQIAREGLVRDIVAHLTADFAQRLNQHLSGVVTASVEKIGAGFNPFTGPVTDNNGVVRIKEGESWGGNKMGNFDWYVEGVIGKAK